MKIGSLFLSVVLFTASSTALADSNSASHFLSEEVNHQNDTLRQSLLEMSNDDLLNLLEIQGEDFVRMAFDAIPEKMFDLPINILEELKINKYILEFIQSYALSRLLYRSDIEGIGQFQSDIGSKRTGTLTVGDWMELSRRATRITDTHVSPLSGTGKIYVFNGIANAEGTWTVDYEQYRRPINYVKISCYRLLNLCVSSEAEVSIPDIDDTTQSLGYYLNINTKEYNILLWNDNNIIAQASWCGTAMLTLNFQNHHVYETVTGLAGDKYCKPYVASLNHSGLEVAKHFWKERAKRTCAYLNPRIRRELAEALGHEESGGCPATLP